MARVEPNYRSNYWGRRTVRNIGRGVAGRVGQTVVRPGGTLAAMGTTLYYLEKRYDVIPDGHRYRNLVFLAMGAIAAGAVVLKALAPAILWIAGKMEDIEVPPSVTDIRILRRAFERESKALNRLNNELVQFRTSLEKAATGSNGLGTVATALGKAITARNYEEARKLLSGDTLTQQIIGAHNKALAGDLAKADKGLDPKLYVEALYLTTMRSAGQVLRSGDYVRIRTTLEQVEAILDREDLRKIYFLGDNLRNAFRRASDAAFKLSQAAPAAPVTPVVPAAAPPAQPAAIPSVPPPPAPLPSVLRRGSP